MIKTTKTEYLVEGKTGAHWFPKYIQIPTLKHLERWLVIAHQWEPSREFRKVQLTTTTTVKRRVIK